VALFALHMLSIVLAMRFVLHVLALLCAVGHDRPNAASRHCEDR